MKATPRTLDLATQSLILDLGRILVERSLGRRIPAATQAAKSLDAEGWDSMVGRIVANLKESPSVLRMLGIQRTTDAARRLRVSAVACLAWQTLRLGSHKAGIGELAAAIADPRVPPIEALLRARDEVGRMIHQAILAGGSDCDRPAFTNALLPTRTLVWLSGGRDSLGFLTYRRAAAKDGGQEDEQVEDATPQGQPVPSARELYERVQPRIIGCERQLKTLCSRISLAVCRAEMLARGERDVGVGNQVIVVFGASGTGKTFCVEEIARASNLVFSSFDGSGLSGTGWAGSNAEDALKQALALAGGDAKRAHRSIVCYDEIDKVLKAGLSQHRSEVMADLLRPLGGHKVTIGGKRNYDCPPTTFDCGPTTFVLSGVFDGLSDLAKRKGGRHGIGFHSSVEDEKAHADWRRAFCQYGAIEELCGRVSTFVQMDPVTADSVAHALIFEHGIVEAFNKVLSPLGVSLMTLEPAVRLIADYAVATGGNYRVAKHLIGTIVEEVLFDDTKGLVLVDAPLVKRAIERANGGEGDLGVKAIPVPGEDADGCEQDASAGAATAGG